MGIKLSELPPGIRDRIAKQMDTAAAKPVKRRGVMNKFEARFAGTLDARKAAGEVRWWAFEEVRIRYGIERAYYTPDFCVVDAGGRTVFYEVKGHRKEAGIARLKAAAKTLPQHQFVLVEQGDYGGWKYTMVGGEL